MVHANVPRTDKKRKNFETKYFPQSFHQDTLIAVLKPLKNSFRQEYETLFSKLQNQFTENVSSFEKKFYLTFFLWTRRMQFDIPPEGFSPMSQKSLKTGKRFQTNFFRQTMPQETLNAVLKSI